MAMMTATTARIAAASRSATATAIATDAAAAATAIAAVTGESLGIAPDQGDANHREENRDAEQQSTIHPSSSNRQVRTEKIEQTGRLSNDSPS
jgi:hypothetical protein